MSYYETELKYIQGKFFKFKYIQVYLKEFRLSSIFKYFQGRYGPCDKLTGRSINTILFMHLYDMFHPLSALNKMFIPCYSTYPVFWLEIGGGARCISYRFNLEVCCVGLPSHLIMDKVGCSFK